MTFPIYLGVIVAAILLWLAFGKLQEVRRKRIYQREFPAVWEKILNEKVGLYPSLPAELKPFLHAHINYFLSDKEFFGRNGQEINDEVRLTIAGNACLLVIHRNKRIFPDFKTIMVYPETYVAKQTSRDGMVVADEHSHRAGESWQRGPIVLSWGDVVRGSDNTKDGHNVVLHEFAHKLDEETALMNGVPMLREGSHFADWSKVMTEEYSEFLNRVNRNKNTVIDDYGAVSPVEFFAVITESFFEKGGEMKHKLPELYAQLARFYQLDPADWP